MAKNHSTCVIASLQVAGVHFWTHCPFEEVMYLREPHRHMFHIRAVKAVTHDDRDVEIIMLKNAIRDYLQKTFKSDQYDDLYFGGMSCEQIAHDIAIKFELTSCYVLEDGENGAFIVMDEDLLP